MSIFSELLHKTMGSLFPRSASGPAAVDLEPDRDLVKALSRRPVAGLDEDSAFASFKKRLLGE